jgi:recombinational DNA repair protein (RecF pathway)
MMHMCERCHRRSDPLTYLRKADEYLCDGCYEDALAEPDEDEYTEPAKYGCT